MRRMLVGSGTVRDAFQALAPPISIGRGSRPRGRKLAFTSAGIGTRDLGELSFHALILRHAHDSANASLEWREINP